mgnify:CR=1 FL=1
MTRANVREREAYAKLADAHRPSRPILRNMALAFVVGGAICVLGQILLDRLVRLRLPFTQAAAMTSTAMVVLGAFLTGIGVYDKIGSIAGMGAALPITGFANSMVSPALEFKREGFILGVSARMFQIAGPVIVYGSVVAVVVSILRVYIFK